MTTLMSVAQLRKLRAQPLWKLLSADSAPFVMGVLQELLLVRERMLPASVMLERLQSAMRELGREGETFVQSAQAYLAQWLTAGWLTRRLPTGAQEEQYELTPDAVAAIRFMQSAATPRRAATESRLSTVMAQLMRLAEETDPDSTSRRESLLEERARIDRELDLLGRGVVQTLSTERALERAREAIALADELAADFRRVREDFEQLNRKLRADLLNNDGSRGEVLEQVFAGIDIIGQTPEGRSFDAFWRLLTDYEQSSILREALTQVTSREFASKLSIHERRFLRNLTSRLMDEGSTVREVLQTFSRGLRTFVESREYREQRRFVSVLRETQCQALEAAQHLRPNQNMGYEFWLSSAKLASASQWRLFNPEEVMEDTDMREAEASLVSLADVASLVRESEIDFAALRRNIQVALESSVVVRIDELMEHYPVTQGLGTLVGYLHLGVREGKVLTTNVRVAWTGMDGVERAALVPEVCFLRRHKMNNSKEGGSA